MCCGLLWVYTHDTGTSGELEANPGTTSHTGAERLFVWWLVPTAQKTVLLTPLTPSSSLKSQRKEVDVA